MPLCICSLCNGYVLFFLQIKAHLLSRLPAQIIEAEHESWNQSQHGVSGLSQADRDDGLSGNHSSRQACTFQGPLKAWAAPLIWGQTSCCLTLSLRGLGGIRGGVSDLGFCFLFLFLGCTCQKFPLLPVSRTPKYCEQIIARKNNSVVLTRGPEKLDAKCKPRTFLDAGFDLSDAAAVSQRHQQINTIQVSL